MISVSLGLTQRAGFKCTLKPKIPFDFKRKVYPNTIIKK